MPKIGLVTTDQGENPEFVEAFQEAMPGAEVELVGALDGMDTEEIDRLAAQSSGYPIQTILADGSTRDIDISLLSPLVEARASEMTKHGVDAIAICCAGAFPDVGCGVPVLYPGRLLATVAASISLSRRIGVVSPIATQMDAAKSNWEADGFDVTVTYASAFKPEEREKAALLMADPSLDLVVLDCMDHTAADRDEFSRICGRPVLAALPLTAQIASEIVG